MISNTKSFMAGAKGSSAFINNEGLLVSNADTSLRHDEGILYDDAMVRVAQKKLTLTSLLRSKGLTKNLGGLGVILSMYERSGEMNGASIDMDGRTRGDQDGLTLDELGVPIPIFHKEYEIGTRKLLASRQRGEGLDVSSVEAATRVVAEEIETHVYNGVPSISVAGNTIYGLTTHPDRSTGNLAADWTSAGGADIVTDTKTMLSALRLNKKYGPYTMIVAGDIWINIQDDYSATKGDNTIRDRILRFSEIEDCIHGEYLADGEVLLIQMESDVLDLAIGQDMDNIEWSTTPMQIEKMVFAALAIRVKSDKNGNSGVAHFG